MATAPTPRLSVAPMMDRTDRFYRFFARQLTRRTLLYTEMITAPAVLHGECERLLAFHPEEHPVALQLGGDDPRQLAEAARIGAALGYDEINLNVGCPSPRVQQGSFGVCLMGRPQHVADLVAAMRAVVPVPVTVKHRIGFDELDRFEDMARFVEIVAAAGCTRFTVHARKAYLDGLDPKANRTVPPLRYADVYRLKATFPHLAIEINGGITDLSAALQHLERVDAVMIGRSAWDEPFLLAAADEVVFGEGGPGPTRREVWQRLEPFVRAELARGVPLGRLLRPTLGLFAGCPGSRAFKRTIAERAHRPGAGWEVAAAACAQVLDAVLDQRPTPLAVASVA